jgi:hypothetical protein
VDEGTCPWPTELLLSVFAGCVAQPTGEGL